MPNSHAVATSVGPQAQSTTGLETAEPRITSSTAHKFDSAPDAVLSPDDEIIIATNPPRRDLAALWVNNKAGKLVLSAGLTCSGGKVHAEVDRMGSQHITGGGQKVVLKENTINTYCRKNYLNGQGLVDNKPLWSFVAETVVKQLKEDLK